MPEAALVAIWMILALVLGQHLVRLHQSGFGLRIRNGNAKLLAEEPAEVRSLQ